MDTAAVEDDPGYLIVRISYNTFGVEGRGSRGMVTASRSSACR